MSSKSKKKTPRPGTKAPDPEAEGTFEEPDAKHFADAAEEVIHVPKGKSPIKFILTVLLVILLTAIFAIDPSWIGRQGGTGGTAFTYAHPTLGTVTVSEQELQSKQRQVDKLTRLFREQGAPSTTEEQAASFILLSESAEAAGITVTDNELRDALRSLAAGFGDAARLRDYMRNALPPGIKPFEETLREQIAGQRYLELVTTLASHVEPSELERIWREGHQEVAYDYVQLDVAALREEAEAEAPDDATLEAWLAALPEFERNAFQEPARTKAELVGFLVDGDDAAAGLLEHFPDLSAEEGSDEEGEDDHEGHDHDDHEGHDHGDEDDADLAKRYYDRVFYFRFARPEPAEGEPALDVTDRYLPFEEVEETAAAEAPIYFALERWLAEVRRQEGEGTTVDLAKEAEVLGLSYRPADEFLSATEWSEVEGWGGPSIGARIARMEVGGVSPILWIERGAILAARLVERQEAYMPELAEIRDEVLEQWARDRAGELAVERLAAIRAEFEPLPDEDDADEDTDEESEEAESLPHATEEAFREAALAQGLEVRRRPYMERQMAFTMDPEKDDPGHTYVRFQAGLAQLEEGELAEPGLNTDQTLAFLVRAAGSRDPEPGLMSPGEFEDARRRAGFEARFGFMDLNFGEETLFERFGVVFTEPPPVE